MFGWEGEGGGGGEVGAYLSLSGSARGLGGVGAYSRLGANSRLGAYWNKFGITERPDFNVTSGKPRKNHMTCAPFANLVEGKSEREGRCA